MDTRMPAFFFGHGNPLNALAQNDYTESWAKIGKNISPIDWAVKFERLVRESVSTGNHEPLINYEPLGRDAKMSAPTPDHYLPLLYILAVQKSADEPVGFPVEGFDGGSISMLSIRIG